MRIAARLTPGIPLLAVACSERALVPDEADPVTDVRPSLALGAGGATPAPDPAHCGTRPAAAITATAAPGRLANQAFVDAATDVPAAVALRCVSQSDPADVHLLEDLRRTTEHSFALAGLLPDDRYDCVVAAVCPSSAASAAVSVETGSAPAELAPATVTVDPTLGMTGAYTLVNLEICDGTSDWLAVYDPVGRLRWWHEIPRTLDAGVEFQHVGDGRFAWGGGGSALGRTRIVDVALGEVYDAAAALPDFEDVSFHHDGKVLPDGRVLTLEAVDNLTPDGVPFEGFRVRLHDPQTGALSWAYGSQQAVDRGELVPDLSLDLDVWHTNWADVAVEGGVDKLYLSLCRTGHVAKVDPGRGEIEWLWGPGGDFALQDPTGAPLVDREFADCQHGMEASSDRLLVYDNGWDRVESRIATYSLDVDAGVSTLTWSWTDGWYAPILGDVDDLGNGRLLVDQAYAGCDTPATRIFELLPDTGEIASELTLRSSDSNYRAERLDGCALFADAAYCPAIAERAATLAPRFDGG